MSMCTECKKNFALVEINSSLCEDCLDRMTMMSQSNFGEFISPFYDEYIPEKKDGCTHEWVLYTGLQESFYHCALCGEIQK
jgi:hypothetical protein